MAVAAVEPHERGADLTLVVAGHPLPVVVSGAGEVSSWGRTGLPLGAFKPLDLAEERLSLARGETLVMFTDGCVGEGADSAEVVRPALTGCARAPLPVVTKAVLELASQLSAERPDDAAVVAARPV
jgi:hypothetical protein